MYEKLAALQDEIEEHIQEIWVQEPRDILYIKNGYIQSGAGIKEQYFTTMVMLSGEVRALGVHIFPDLLFYAKSGDYSLEQLIHMTERSLQIDLGVVGYFGLEKYGNLLQKYFEVLECIENKEEYITVTQGMFTLTNRYQLWMHQIFPWYLAVHFPKADIEKRKEFIVQIAEEIV